MYDIIAMIWFYVDFIVNLWVRKLVSKVFLLIYVMEVLH
jgi:hypothetical protein